MMDNVFDKRDQPIEEVSKRIEGYLRTLRRMKSLSAKHKSKDLKYPTSKLSPEKIQDLIQSGPYTMNRIDHLDLFEKFPDLNGLQIIETLKVTDSNLTFYYSSNNQGHIERASLSTFFKKCHRSSSKFSYPSFILKSSRDTVLLFSESEVIEALKKHKKCLLMKYVFPKYNKCFKIRIHWKSNGGTQCFLITNKLTVNEYKKSQRKTRSLSTTEPNIERYSKETSYYSSLDNSTHSNFFQNFTTCAKKVVKRQNTIDNDRNSKLRRIYLLEEDRTSLWDIQKVPQQDSDIIKMTEKLVYLLNSSKFLKFNVKEIVIDYIKDHRNVWHFLKIVQIANGEMKSKKHHRSDISLTRKINLNGLNPSIEKMIDYHLKTANTNDGYHTKRMKAIKAMKANYNVSLNSRVLSLATQYKDSTLPCVLPKPYSMTESIDHYYRNRKIDVQGRIHAKYLSEDLESSPVNKSKDFLHNFSRHPLLNTKVETLLATSSFDLDLIKYKTRHFKKGVICMKYGGDRFVKDFVAELYFQILQSEVLSPSYKSLDHTKLVNIVKYFKLFFNLELSPSMFKNHHSGKPLQRDQKSEYCSIFRKVAHKFEMHKMEIELLVQEIQSLSSNFH